MQLKKENFDSRERSQYKALSVNQPYAQHIADGEKTLEIRSRNTTLRGDVVICSTAKPHVCDYLCGAILCKVEIYDVVKFKDLSDIEKAQSKIPQNQWKQYKDYYAWKLRNVRKVIEKPVIGGQGLWTLYCTDDYVDEYPEELGERVLTPAERVREYAETVKSIKHRSRVGLITIGIGALSSIAAIFGIVKLIIWLVSKIA